VKSLDGELPAELDFFKYAQGSSKRKVIEGAASDRPEGKKRKTESDCDKEEDDEDDGQTESAPLPRHRLVMKGSDIPQPVNSFQALKARYQISSHVLANLSRNGYTHPTGIQSSGIPILLEASLFPLFLGIVKPENITSW
jgi:ATP-dependent RNA helicase DDX52/ROK1